MKKRNPGELTPSSTPIASNALKTNTISDFQPKIETDSSQVFSLQQSPFSVLRDFCKEKKIMFTLPRAYVDYTPPKLSKGVVWFIYYYVRNPFTGQKKRFRIRIDHFKSISERRKAAREIMASLSEKLSLGWNPILDGTSSFKRVHTISELFEAYVSIKFKEMEQQSITSYNSLLGRFRKWLESQGIPEAGSASLLTRQVAISYMLYLENDPKISPATYNNYLKFMMAMFGWMKKHDYVAENIFDNIDRKPKRLTRKKRRLLSLSELNILFDYLRKENLEYLAICQLCYCCFMRPKEISLLKVSDLDLSRQVVHVRAEIAKNDNESYRTIPNSIMPVILGLDLARPDDYIFGKHPGDPKSFKPGSVPTDPKTIGHYWERHIEKALQFGDGVSFYSLKDSGITNALSEGVPLNYVQQQADHSSPAITGIYVGKKAAANDVLRNVDILHSRK